MCEQAASPSSSSVACNETSARAVRWPSRGGELPLVHPSPQLAIDCRVQDVSDGTHALAGLCPPLLPAGPRRPSQGVIVDCDPRSSHAGLAMNERSRRALRYLAALPLGSALACDIPRPLRATTTRRGHAGLATNQRARRALVLLQSHV